MRFKSRAQRRKFAELLVKGEISPEIFEDWNRDTGSAKLPERVKPAKKRGRRRKAKSGKAGSKARTTRRSPSKSRTKSKRKTKRARK